MPRDRRRPAHALDRDARERRRRQRARDGRRASDGDPPSRAGGDPGRARRRRAADGLERRVPRRRGARLRGRDPGRHRRRARALQVLAQHRDLRAVRRRRRGVLALRPRGEGLDRRLRQRRHAGRRSVAGAARADHVEAAPQRSRRARRAARRRPRAHRVHRPGRHPRRAAGFLRRDVPGRRPARHRPRSARALEDLRDELQALAGVPSRAPGDRCRARPAQRGRRRRGAAGRGAHVPRRARVLQPRGAAHAERREVQPPARGGGRAPRRPAAARGVRAGGARARRRGGVAREGVRSPRASLTRPRTRPATVPRSRSSLQTARGASPGRPTRSATRRTRFRSRACARKRSR